MNEIKACPPVNRWKDFVVGQLPVTDIEELGAHLHSCSSCEDEVKSIPLDDALLETLRSNPTDVEMSEEVIIEQLINRLKEVSAASMSTYHSDDSVCDEEEVPDAHEHLSPPEEADEIGRLGNYRVLRLLGKGGMGAVFQAEELPLHRMVALKVMHANLQKKSKAQQRFLREAQITASLNHDHIVAVFQAGEHEGVPFLAMPLLEGESLDAYLKREGKLSVEESIRITREVAEGLAAAHARGLIHRDIKPGNLWLEGDKRRIKILDFGLARMGEESGQITQSGAIIGTPAYMAPEQANGEKVDARSDLFSLGCVLYCMLTGQGPFDGPTPMSSISQVLIQEPQAPHLLRSEIPQALSHLIMQLLSKVPNERPDTGEEVIQTLITIEKSLKKKPVEILPANNKSAVSPRPQTQPTFRRFQNWKAVAAVLLLSLIGWGMAQIIIKIQNKKGEVVGELKLRKDYGAVIVNQDKTPPNKDGKTVRSKPPVEVAMGEPMAKYPLVTKPAKIPGVLSWEIVTKRIRGQYFGTARMPHEAAFSPDGRYLATCSGHHNAAYYGDRVLRIWDVKTGKLHKALVGPHGGQTTGLAWSPDGKYLVCPDSNSNHPIYLWDVEAGQMTQAIGSSTIGVTLQSAWSPDGEILATMTQNAIYFWDPTLGKLKQVLRNHQDHGSTLSGLAWSPDGNWFACGNSTDTVLYPIKGGFPDRINQRRIPTGSVNGLIFTPESKQLLCAGSEKATIHAVPTGGLIRELSPDEQKRFIKRPLIWLEQGKQLACATGIWDVKTGKLVWETTRDIGWKLLDWTSNGELVATSTPQAVKVTKKSNGEAVMTIESTPILTGASQGYSHLWSPDGKYLTTYLSALSGGTLWDIQKAEVARIPLTRHIPLLGLHWSPSGKHLFYRAINVGVVLDPATMTSKLSGIDVPLAVAPDGKTFLVQLPNSGTVSLHHMQTGGKQVKKWQPHGEKDQVTASFSPDGNWLITKGGSEIKIWDLKSEEPVHTIKTEHPGMGIHWAKDRDIFACGDSLWNVETGKRVLQLKGNLINIAQWSQDGKALLVYEFSDSQRLAQNQYPVAMKIIDAKTGKVLRKPSLRPMPLSPDFKTGIFRDSACAAKIMDVEKAEPISVLVSLGRERVLAISKDGHVKAYPDTLNDIVYVVQTKEGQITLTPEEFAKKYGWKNDPSRVRLAVH